VKRRSAAIETATRSYERNPLVHFCGNHHASRRKRSSSGYASNLSATAVQSHCGASPRQYSGWTVHLIAAMSGQRRSAAGSPLAERGPCPAIASADSAQTANPPANPARCRWRSARPPHHHPRQRDRQKAVRASSRRSPSPVRDQFRTGEQVVRRPGTPSVEFE
jgi:hypothetical protein